MGVLFVQGVNEVIRPCVSHVAFLIPVILIAGCVPAPSSNVGGIGARAASSENVGPDSEDGGTEHEHHEGDGHDHSAHAGGSQSGPDDPDAPTEFTTAESGLKYRILRKGEGRKPTAADTVRCHYKGTLDDGSEFDSSYSRGEPTSFPLNGVIAGWTEGLQYIGEGGKIDLEIPYNLAYGEAGRPPTIPPKATLHFIVELIAIE